MSEIRVARLVQKGKPLVVGRAPKPAPGPYEVLVRVAACGLVPNTFNIVNGRTPFTLPEPAASFGLDAAGTIEAVGEKVVGLEVGDRVYVDPFLTCETCHDCRRGRRELCHNWALRGYMTVTPTGKKLLDAYPYGGLSEYLVSPRNKVSKLPDSIDFLTAARFGYMCTSFGALRKGKLRPGDVLMINGVTGTLGVAAVAIALGMGASRVLGVGRNRQILEQVRALCPERVAVMSSEDGDTAAWGMQQTNGQGVDLVYDCLGVGGDSQSTSTMLKALKSGGAAVLVAGGVEGELKQKYFEVLIFDRHTRGSNWFTDEDIDRMVAMIGSGLIDTSYLEHKVFALEDVNQAMELVGSRPGGFQNVVVSLQ